MKNLNFRESTMFWGIFIVILLALAVIWLNVRPIGQAQSFQSSSPSFFSGVESDRVFGVSRETSGDKVPIKLVEVPVEIKKEPSEPIVRLAEFDVKMSFYGDDSEFISVALDGTEPREMSSKHASLGGGNISYPFAWNYPIFATASVLYSNTVTSVPIDILTTVGPPTVGVRLFRHPIVFGAAPYGTVKLRITAIQLVEETIKPLPCCPPIIPRGGKPFPCRDCGIR